MSIDLLSAINKSKITDNVEDEFYNFINQHPGETLRFLDGRSRTIKDALSPEAQQLLNWYPFRKKSSLLEIGGEYGALTELFAEKCQRVAVLEKDPNKIKIIKKRLGENNVSFTSNLGSEKYDYIAAIGAKTASVDFLMFLKKHLNDKGVLILAINNSLGLRNWNGETSPSHPPFNEVQDSVYGDSEGISRDNLKDNLKKSGFNKIAFFYPMPVFRCPKEIFSDEYLPSPSHPISPHSSNLGYRENQVVSDNLALRKISKSEAFPIFANSFLVLAEEN